MVSPSGWTWKTYILAGNSMHAQQTNYIAILHGIFPGCDWHASSMHACSHWYTGLHHCKALIAIIMRYWIFFFWLRAWKDQIPLFLSMTLSRSRHRQQGQVAPLNLFTRSPVLPLLVTHILGESPSCGTPYLSLTWTVLCQQSSSVWRSICGIDLLRILILMHHAHFISYAPAPNAPGFITLLIFLPSGNDCITVSLFISSGCQ